MIQARHGPIIGQRQWWRSSTALFLFTWLVLPNLAFLPLWITGGPPRPTGIALYVVVGLLARRLPLLAVALLLVAAIALDIVLTLSGIFNLLPDSLLYAVKFLPQLDLSSSLHYSMVLLGLALAVAAILYLSARKRQLMAQASVLPTAACALLLIGGDHLLNLSPEIHFGRYLSADAPFESGLRSSGLADDIQVPAGNRNIAVIMVESLGLMTDPAHQDLLAAWTRQPALRERFEVEQGTSSYYGSTTAAEIRELCGRWQEYNAYLHRAAPDCLPARLSAAGYQTTALHAFTGAMFERKAWYPNIGFDRPLFFEQMYRPGDRSCPNVFTGLCDVDVADRVADILRRGHEQPQFVHWLTLNTHVPVPPRDGPSRLDCESGGPFENVMVCTMAELWLDLFAKITEIALLEDLPPTDFLIVGDHAPPLWSRQARGLFVSGKVPWVVLRDQRGDPAEIGPPLPGAEGRTAAATGG